MVAASRGLWPLPRQRAWGAQECRREGARTMRTERKVRCAGTGMEGRWSSDRSPFSLPWRVAGVCDCVGRCTHAQDAPIQALSVVFNEGAPALRTHALRDLSLSLTSISTHISVCMRDPHATSCLSFSVRLRYSTQPPLASATVSSSATRSALSGAGADAGANSLAGAAALAGRRVSTATIST